MLSEQKGQSKKKYEHCIQKIMEIREEGIWRVSLEISNKMKSFEWQKVKKVKNDICYLDVERKVHFYFL